MLQTLPVRGKRFAAAAIVAAGLLIAACGDDDSESSTESTPESATAQTTAGSTAGSTAETPAPATDGGDSAGVVAQYTQVPTEIVQTEALSKAPDPKKVTFIVCADPSCVVLSDYLKDAVTALGWEFTSLNAPGDRLRLRRPAGDRHPA